MITYLQLLPGTLPELQLLSSLQRSHGGNDRFRELTLQHPMLTLKSPPLPPTRTTLRSSGISKIQFATLFTAQSNTHLTQKLVSQIARYRTVLLVFLQMDGPFSPHTKEIDHCKPPNNFCPFFGSNPVRFPTKQIYKTGQLL